MIAESGLQNLPIWAQMLIAFGLAAPGAVAFASIFRRPRSPGD